MTEADIRLIALFFFYAFLDEKYALSATIQTTALCENKLKKNEGLSHHALIVFATRKIWSEQYNRIVRGKPTVSLESGWLLNDKIDLGPWKEFQKNADPQELLAVIWSRILNIADDDISKGSGVTIGTVRFRVGRSLKKLGKLSGPRSSTQMSMK